MSVSHTPEPESGSVPLYPGHSLRRLGLSEDLKRRLLDACLDGPSGEAAALCEQLAAAPGAPVELWYHAGKHRFAQGLFEQAHAALIEGVRREPGFAAAWRLLGQTCMRLGAFEEAANHLARSTSLDPRDYVAWACLALALDLCGRRAESLKALHQAIDNYPVKRCLSRRLALQIAFSLA